MNVVFLSPHFPLNLYNFCHHLRDKGVNVLGIDQVNYEDLKEPLRLSLKDYYKVSDLHNYHELLQACEYFIGRHGAIHHVESHNEYWLQTQANLATHFQIPGGMIKNDKIESIKRKSHMKKIFQSVGMRPAQGNLVPNFPSALELVEKIGYPVIVKPDIGVGAGGFQKIHNENELNEFFGTKPSQEYIMEEFIEGDVWSFDGLADRQGKILFYTSHVYHKGIAEVVQHQLDTYYYSLKDLPSDLEKIGRETVEAYQVKESFFHMEYFRTHKDGHLVPIEVNIRPPGGLTLDMCNYACDIDLYRQWANMIAGDSTPFYYERKYHCMAITRRFKHTYLHSHQQILDQWHRQIVHHEKTLPVFYATMGDYCYLARSPHLEELFDIQRFIQKQYSLTPS